MYSGKCLPQGHFEPRPLSDAKFEITFFDRFVLCAKNVLSK